MQTEPMMGERRSGQEALFYEFSLERHVPAEHLLRSIERFVELDGLRCELAPFYSEVGRPSIDPELMIRMLIVGYCFGILRAAVVRGGPPEPRRPLVLPAWTGWCGAGSLDLLEEPARPFPRERSAAQGVRDDRAALY